jgi:uncharacterized protein involved in oxidation of intracellular sulfur
MEFVFVFNDSPYGSQRAYNGLRLALGIAQESPIGVFLLGDGVTCGFSGLAPAEVDYDPQTMLRSIAELGNPIVACGTCMQARGLTAESLIPGIERGTMVQLVDWCRTVPKILNF